MTFFIIHWKSYLVSGSEVRNPGKEDKNRLECYGEGRVEAETPKEAAEFWLDAFPFDKICSVRRA